MNLFHHRENWHQTFLRFVTCICLLISGSLTAQIVQAQNTDLLGSRFFSSTITLHDESRMEASFYDIDRNLVFHGVPLVDVISRAYGLQGFQIADGPDWIYMPHLYDIKAAPPPSFVQSADHNQMLIAMLADRFKLVVQNSSREMTVLALEVEGENPGLQWLSNETGNAFSIRATPSASGYRDIRITSTFDALAHVLSKELKQPVVDFTGLTGTYVIELKETASKNSLPVMTYTPLLDQVGLRLESRATLVSVLVVSDIARPDLDN